MTEPIFFCNFCDFASASQNYEIFCTIQRLHPVVKQAGLDGPTGIANDEDQSVVCCEHTIGYEPFRIIVVDNFEFDINTSGKKETFYNV